MGRYDVRSRGGWWWVFEVSTGKIRRKLSDESTARRVLAQLADDKGSEGPPKLPGLDTLGLPPRTVERLAAAGVGTIEAARALDRDDFIRLKGIGEATADAVLAALAA